MPKAKKPAAKKNGAAPSMEALKRLMGTQEEPDVRVMKRGSKDKDEDGPNDPALKKIFDDAQKTQLGSAMGIKWLDVDCPHCGESFEVRVDASQEGQEVVQDCASCSASVTLAVEVEDGVVSLNAYQ